MALIICLAPGPHAYSQRAVSLSYFQHDWYVFLRLLEMYNPSVVVLLPLSLSLDLSLSVLPGTEEGKQIFSTSMNGHLCLEVW